MTKIIIVAFAIFRSKFVTLVTKATFAEVPERVVRFPNPWYPVVTFRGRFLGRAFIRWCAIAAAAFLAGAWVTVLAVPNVSGDATLIVHYTTTFGIDALGSWRDLAQVPLSGVALLFVNCLLAWFLARAPAAPETSPDDARTPLPDAPAVLMVATAVIEFAVLVNTVLLWRANM